MGKQMIYNILREGGLSRIGALAMMGNIGAESNFQSNIVEKRCPMSDYDYTANVDHGYMSENTFINDAYGYGLCQWTLPYRKRKLLECAKMNLCSVGDEMMQAMFIVQELTKEGEYANLYNYLCEATDLYEATSKICTIYERPAINNIDARYSIARRCETEVIDGEPDTVAPPHEDCDDDSCPIDFGSTDSCQIQVRMLRYGDKGRDVYLLQCGLDDMGIDTGTPDGDFGQKTETAVNELKHNTGLDADGVADTDVWQIIFQ